MKKDRSQQKGTGLNISAGDPELGGEVCPVPFKDPHPFVGQHVQEVDASNIEIGYADEEQVMVLDLINARCRRSDR